MPGFGDVAAWTFLSKLYAVPGIKAYFDAVALHPYGANLNKVKMEIQRVRNVMKNRADAATPLWVDRDRVGISASGQPRDQQGAQRSGDVAERRLQDDPEPSNLVEHRARVLVPLAGSPSLPCDVQLLRQRRGSCASTTPPKPAMTAFRSFTADAIPPQAAITAGPPNGGLVNDATPTFKFASNQIGSTFQCHFDARPFAACSSPFTPFVALSQGTHAFYVRAIDAPGNVSATVSRTFTVDTIPPPTPKITATNPSSPADNNSPKVRGNAAAGHGGEAVHDRGLHRRAGRPGLHRGVRHARDHGLGSGQHHDLVPCHRDRRRRQSLRVLGPVHLRRGLDSVGTSLDVRTTSVTVRSTTTH